MARAVILPSLDAVAPTLAPPQWHSLLCNTEFNQIVYILFSEPKYQMK